MPSPPPQSQKKTVTWHDFLKETKELSWQEALLETHFESTTTNKPGLVRASLHSDATCAVDCI